MQDSLPPADVHDPHLAPFLGFLGRDLEMGCCVIPVEPALIQRAKGLVAGVEVQLDEILDPAAD